MHSSLVSARTPIESVIGNSLLFDSKITSIDMSFEEIRQSVKRLFRLFAERKVPYLLVGGIAS